MRSLALLVLPLWLGCGPTWDPDRDGVPRLAHAMPLDVSVLAQISRFRSGAGHDFSDGVERCRSMKHYLWPRGGSPGATHTPSWSTIELRAPLAGRISRIVAERSAGQQVYLQSTENPAFTVRLFHVTPEVGLSEGSVVEVGALLGHNTSDDTYTDIAVEVNRGLDSRLVSFAELLTDEALAPLLARGLESRQALIITREARDAAPLACAGEQFTAPDAAGDWVQLR